MVFVIRPAAGIKEEAGHETTVVQTCVPSNKDLAMKNQSSPTKYKNVLIRKSPYPMTIELLTKERPSRWRLGFGKPACCNRWA